MTNKVYDVYTNLDPEQLTAVAAETYRKWLQFALGNEEIGGKTLAHPSGRYAASLSWKRTGVASVAIIADETAAPEAGAIEEGRAGADMKAKMLGGGKTKVSKDGYLYRVIPMRRDSVAPTLGADAIVASLKGGSLKAGVKRMWGKARKSVDQDRFRTMTNRPGSAPWRIEPFQPYAPGQILSILLKQNYGI